jgi:hypothetical protein
MAPDAIVKFTIAAFESIIRRNDAQLSEPVAVQQWPIRENEGDSHDPAGCPIRLTV